ncbi:class D sortase [Salipaludibacillus sp. HK11]|uniref:class D sortase n=1 Tax=Salipaludibacillus sp. HK11 TaxID=3394320 RepID=UPI0039FC6FF7
MTKNPKINWIIASIFFVSLIVIISSASHIYLGASNVEESLDEWNEKIELSNQDNLEIDDLFQEDVEEKKSQRDRKSYSKKEENLVNSKAAQEDGFLPIYEKRPERGEVIGKIYIPKLNRELPIIHGSDDDELDRGVGHFIGSVLPGENDNTVLAGHRDTVFQSLGQVGAGDQIEIETQAGYFVYEIFEERIVDEDDRTVIVPYDEPILTLVTCYPFDFIGAAPERYILTGKLIEANGESIG